MEKTSIKTIVILGILLISAASITALVAFRLFNPPTPQTISDVQLPPLVSSSEMGLAVDEECEPQIPSNPSESSSSLEETNHDMEYDEHPAEDTEDEPPIEPVEFSFENGIEGLEELEELLLAKIEPLWGEYSIYVKNLNTNEYLAIHHRQQTPASLIKLFNMAYAFEKIENGTLELTPVIEQWIYESIVISCNNSYNHLLASVGYGNMLQGAIDATDFAHSQGFEDTIVGGSLHPSYSAIIGFSNIYSSVLDVGHLLENIYRGTMISEEASSQMMDILLAQQWLHKIPAGLPEGTVTASKTGEIGILEHDAAIVFTENVNYVIVIMTENAFSAHHYIQEISRLVYNYLVQN